MGKQKLLVVLGPTASGKTELALTLSRHLGGEMVGADSMQIYAGLTVGTAAITPEEAGGIPQHLTGFLPLEERFSVAQWVDMAKEAVAEIAARGRVPVVCGGTGLYLSSLLEGTLFLQDTAPEVRAALEAELAAEGVAALYTRLKEADPAHAARLHLSDEKRIVRALEQSMVTGMTAAERAKASKPEEPPYEALCIGLACEDRGELYRRIDTRVDRMMERGLLREAALVYENREAYGTAAQAIGYKEFFPYFEGGQELAACVAALKQATRRYAKRQLTWFRRMPDIHWLEAGAEDTCEKALALARGFYGV